MGLITGLPWAILTGGPCGNRFAMNIFLVYVADENYSQLLPRE